MAIKNRDRKYLDAEWILRNFGTTHLTAKVDRTHNWPEAPKVTIGYDAIMTFIDERWEHKTGKNDCSMMV